MTLQLQGSFICLALLFSKWAHNAMISLSPRSVVSAVRLKPALAKKKCTLPLSSKTGWRQGCLRGQARIPPGSLQDACLLRGWRWALQVACLNSWIRQVPLPHLVQTGRLPQGAVNPALRIKGFCDWTARKATLPKLSLSDEEATAAQGHMRSQCWLLVQNECVCTPWPPPLRERTTFFLSLHRGPFKFRPVTGVTFTTPSMGKTAGALPDESQLWLFIQQMPTVDEISHIYFIPRWAKTDLVCKGGGGC